MASQFKILKYYSRKFVQEALLESSRKREIVGVYGTGSFDKRPNILVYQNDIMEMVKKGIVSFHGSVERWLNPMSLESGMTPTQMQKLRIGWDLIIDPDCPDFEISKKAVKIICESLEDHGMSSYSIKFTGGKGFHIGIPFEALPKKINGEKIEHLYPEVAKAAIEYLKNYSKEQMKESFLEMDNPMSLAKRVNKPIDDIVDKDGINPLKIVEIDSMIASPRHMFRLPYSLHEKSLLVSLPLSIDEIDQFQREDAEPSKVEIKRKFLSQDVPLADATGFIIEALDWMEKNKVEDQKREYVGKRAPLKEIPKENFPPCIKKILQGVSDGRKRSLFVLTTFLQNMGWTWEKIEKEIEEWNMKNPRPLPKNYINTQLRWHQRQPKGLLPPNCDNDNYYKNFIGDVKDECCQGIKNPVNYVFKKMKGKKDSAKANVS